MSVDVLALLKNRCNYPMGLPKKLDSFIDEAIKNEPEECSFVTTDSIFLRYCSRNNKMKNYYVTAVFDMSRAYLPSFSAKVSLFVLSKKKSLTVKTGVYFAKEDKRAEQYIDSDKANLKMSDKLSDDFFEYCNLINSWINSDIKAPNDTDCYEFNLVERFSFRADRPFAYCYTKQVRRIYDLLKHEHTVKLNELADIIIPKSVESLAGNTLFPDCLTYPLDKKRLQKGANTDVAVKKGDIILCRYDNMMYLVNEDLKEVYINKYMRIIRPHPQVLPEYLFVYLNSDTSKTIIESLSTGAFIKHLSTEDLSTMPVIKPPKNTDDYKEIFRLMFVSDDKNSVSELTELIAKLKAKSGTLEGVLLSEQIKKLKLIRNPQVRSIIFEDLKELKTCYNNHAYKATLILAGSILEAFVIDWLSELHGKDYFYENYVIASKPNKRAELVDYINAIADIKKPDWMEEASKAHIIRKQRNKVHAKLCMKTGQDINDETCKMVIDYLIEIISTRYKYFDFA